MPTIKESLYFNFDGTDCRELGLCLIDTGSGLYEEDFGVNVSFREVERNDDNPPIFFGEDLSTREIELNIAFLDGFNEQKLDEIIRWLYVPYYRPLYFIGKENKISYCKPIGQPKINHNGLDEGYITVTFRTNSPYYFSPVSITNEIEVVEGEKKTIEIFNDGHVSIKPEISIYKHGLGDINIINRSDSGKTMILRNITDKEDLYINCDKKIIQTDLIGQYRYDSISGNFLELVYGKNVIEIEGGCNIQFRYHKKYKF